MTQAKRDESMTKFYNGDATILVATNACSRALNLGGKLVINYDVPMKFGGQFDQKTYTYRISRTGRFGHPGIAITFNSKCDSDIKALLKRDYGVNVTQI